MGVKSSRLPPPPASRTVGTNFSPHLAEAGGGAGDTGSPFTHCSWLWPYLQDQFLGGSCLLKSLQAPCHPQPLASSSLSLGGLTGRWEEKGPLPVLWSCHGLLGKHSSLLGSLPPSGL